MFICVYVQLMSFGGLVYLDTDSCVCVSLSLPFALLHVTATDVMVAQGLKGQPGEKVSRLITSHWTFQ